MRPAHLLVLVPLVCLAQEPVTIRVDAAHALGPVRPIWSFFGYDEPNYTYAPNGAKLIGELGGLRAPVFIRAHNLLTTGDGTPALKWGSTNAYTEDANGKPRYDWTIVDRIVDTYIHAHAHPLIEIGFMPRALSVRPEPYQHSWPKTHIAAGWAYPPKDYEKWSELIYRWVRHSVDRYGEAEVKQWWWEVWNEPDIEYWQGTAQEYNKLYDYAAAGVKRAMPEARVGGPASTGPANQKAAAFLRQFLEHCRNGTNGATGRPGGAPLDFITFHAKGQPSLIDAHVQMGLGKELSDVAHGMEIVGSFPQFQKLPIILSEADPEGCAACSARTSPQNAYRNGALYPCYTAAAMKGILQLADEQHAHIEGMLTWAFEFEGQPYFDGFRTLATNGIDKPILNFFRMASLMSGERVAAQSSAAIPLNRIMDSGVRDQPDVDTLAARDGRSVSVMIWNYDDRDVDAPDAAVHLRIEGIAAHAHAAKLWHYRIDRDHSNAYTAWKKIRSPQKPNAEQYAALEKAGHLETVAAPASVPVRSGQIEYSFDLPRQGLSLVVVQW